MQETKITRVTWTECIHAKIIYMFLSNVEKTGITEKWETACKQSNAEINCVQCRVQQSVCVTYRCRCAVRGDTALYDWWRVLVCLLIWDTTIRSLRVSVAMNVATVTCLVKRGHYQMHCSQCIFFFTANYCFYTANYLHLILNTVFYFFSFITLLP